ncbi:hypothetical protein [Arcobacter sp. LA11]|uniref:hypothetical protein n=1 Tax=Arcobacter sp. LA11 TaxID=1898176 RepID=UPI000933E0C6|nr:hypothetical protein [Arcobacter sp. LA11]
MTELLFVMACVLIYLYSFLYRNIAILASGMTILVASYVDVNLYFVIAMVLILGIIRINKTGIRDDS